MENKRQELYELINKCVNLTDSDVVRASQELDTFIVTEMLRINNK